MKKLSKQDVIYSLLLLAVGFVVGYNVPYETFVELPEEYKEINYNTPIKGQYIEERGIVVIEFDHGAQNK